MVESRCKVETKDRVRDARPFGHSSMGQVEMGWLGISGRVQGAECRVQSMGWAVRQGGSMGNDSKVGMGT